jgi:Rieske Fe-S protein
MTEGTDQPGLTRRDALRVAAGLCGITLLAAGANTAQAAPAPTSAVTTLKNGRVRVNLRRVPALRKVGGVATIGLVRGIPAAVVRTGVNTYVALNLRCTHQGVTVRETSAGWSCPAHGSSFAKTGARTGGPAQSALSRLRLVRRNNALTIG